MMMKQHKILSAILSLTFVWIGVSCSNEGDYPLEPAVQGDFIITVVQEGLSNTETRAVTDETYMTDFEEGDCIGLFAVQNGTIKDGFKNLPVTLTAGEWVPKDLNFRLDEAEEAGTTYYAYFPYDKTLDISSVNTTDFFQGLVDSWALDNDQSTKEKFVDTDLMTTLEGVSVIQNEQGQYTIPLRLTHRMAMAVVSLPSVEYVFQNTDVDLNSTPYVTQPSGVAFYKGNIAEDNIVKPYLMENGSYRLIVKPGEELDIIGVANEKQYKLQTAIAAGKYKYFEVAGGKVVNDKHLLEIGDFYCKDGSLIKATELKSEDIDKIIGVVYYVGNAQPSVLYVDEEGFDETHDALRRDYPNCVHGLVYAVEIANDANYARFASSDKDANDFGAFFKNNYAGAYLWDSGKSLSTTGFGHFLGYNNTRVLYNIEENDKPTLLSNDMLKILNDFAADEALSEKYTTGWYLPSLKEMEYLFNNQDIINNSFNKVGGQVLWSNPQGYSNEKDYMGYWTSTHRGGTYFYGAGSSDNSFKSIDVTSGKKGKGYFRFAFAF